MLRLRRHLLRQISRDLQHHGGEEDEEASPPPGPILLLAGDLGCLMNMAGKLKREGSPINVRHVAEVLAGDTATPPIAEAE